MNKIILLISICLISCTQTEKSYYDSGNLKKENFSDRGNKTMTKAYLDDGVETLDYIDYYSDSNSEPDSTSSYLNNKLYSTEIRHYGKNGQTFVVDKTLKIFDRESNLIEVKDISYTFETDYEGGLEPHESRFTTTFENGIIVKKRKSNVIIDCYECNPEDRHIREETVFVHYFNREGEITRPNGSKMWTLAEIKHELMNRPDSSIEHVLGKPDKLLQYRGLGAKHYYYRYILIDNNSKRKISGVHIGVDGNFTNTPNIVTYVERWYP